MYLKSVSIIKLKIKNNTSINMSCFITNCQHVVWSLIYFLLFLNNCQKLRFRNLLGFLSCKSIQIYDVFQSALMVNASWIMFIDSYYFKCVVYNIKCSDQVGLCHPVLLYLSCLTVYSFDIICGMIIAKNYHFSVFFITREFVWIQQGAFDLQVKF